MKIIKKKMPKIRVKTFAEVAEGFHNGQVVFLKEKRSTGYFCKGVGPYGFQSYIFRKDLKPLTRKNIFDLKSLHDSAKEEVDFYAQALKQLDATYEAKRTVTNII